jgi:hypothetical protein
MSRFCFIIAIVCVLSCSFTVAQAADLSGSWSGYWTSDNTGHRGPLRCTMVQLSDGSYEAHFSGRFFKVLPFRYSVVLNVIQDGDTVLLAGDHQLGRRGNFHYDAEASCQDFVASYSSCKDAGQFVLSRCCVCGQCSGK